MTADENAIRRLIDAWMEASRRGDVAAVLALMTDDVEFLVPGQEPFGKAAFAAAMAGMGGMRMEGRAEILEVQVSGDWAFLRNRIGLTVTPPGGTPVHRAGHTLSVLHKGANGQWRLARDANLVMARD